MAAEPLRGFGLAVCLGANFSQLYSLPDRERSTQFALFRIAEGAAVLLHAPFDGAQELPLPFGKFGATAIGRAFRPFQCVDRRAFGALARIGALGLDPQRQGSSSESQ